MPEHKLIKVDDLADPSRCQAVTSRGQCENLSVDGQKYCAKHGGTSNATLLAKQRTNDYRLQIWQTRVDEFSASEQVYNLRGEIGILRMQVEQIFNMCGTAQDLMIYSSKIADLVMKIERVVSSCATIERRQGNLLDKSAALVLAGQVVDIISQHVKDPNAVDKISEDLITLITRLSGKDLPDDS